MPILHRRILPCLAPPAAAAGGRRWPAAGGGPGARGRAGQPHHLGRHAGRAGPHPRTGAGALSPGPTAPAPAPPCRPRSSGASTPCRSRGNRTRMRRPNSAGCARTPGPDARRPGPGADARVIARDRADATADRAVWRALYSPNQLQEQMTWFWMNHFNVYAPRATWAFIGSYEDRAIRAHALGKFRDLLAATIRSPAMLLYLDNAQNAAGKINENYARELMELHTLGVKGGYTQTDVQELARILTGLGIGRPDEPPAAARAARAGGAGRAVPVQSGAPRLRRQAVPGPPHRRRRPGRSRPGRGPAGAPSGHRPFHQRQAGGLFPGRRAAARAGRQDGRTFLASDGDIAAVLQTLYASPEFARSLDAGVFRTRCTMCIRRCGWPMPACRPSSIPGPR